MTREEAYNFLTKEASNTSNGLMVHISCVENAIELVSTDDELKEKALNGIYDCKGNSLDWMQLGDAEYFIDVALGIEED